MHGGRISANSARKIRNAIDWLEASAELKYIYSKKNNRFYSWKLSFLTLTLPTQGTMSDLQVKEILNAFLTLAKYNYGLKSYIWKAEPQARGVIHFHITSDCYMWKNSLRFEWNRLLSKSGLLNGHTDAPSTKIHSTYRVRNMAAYLCKYFIKGNSDFTQPPFKQKITDHYPQRHGKIVYEEKCTRPLFYIRPIQGRLWGCSQNLSKARSMAYCLDESEMRDVNADLRSVAAREIQKAYCNYFQLPDGFWDTYAGGVIKQNYIDTIMSIRKQNVKDRYDIRGEDGKEIADKKILRRFEKQLQKKPHHEN